MYKITFLTTMFVLLNSGCESERKFERSGNASSVKDQDAVAQTTNDDAVIKDGEIVVVRKKVGDPVCEPDTQDTTYVPCVVDIDFAASAEKAKECNADGTAYLYGSCTLKKCETGYDVIANKCVAKTCVALSAHDPVECINTIVNSSLVLKSKTCNSVGDGYEYGSCILQSCDSGYTMSGQICIAVEVPKYYLNKDSDQVHFQSAVMHNNRLFIGGLLLNWSGVAIQKTARRLYAYSADDLSLDTTFGNNGFGEYVFAGYEYPDNGAGTILPLSDGRFIVIDRSNLPRYRTLSIHSAGTIVAFMPNGQVDTNFATGGVFPRPSENRTRHPYEWVNAIAEDASGNLHYSLLWDREGILHSPRIDSLRALSVGKISSGGGRDQLFGNPTYQAEMVFETLEGIPRGVTLAKIYHTNRDGSLKTSLSKVSVGSFQNLRVDSQNRILASGYSQTSSPGDLGGNWTLYQHVLARWLPNGTLDSSFGSGGVVQVKPLPVTSDARVLVPLASNKTLVVGTAIVDTYDKTNNRRPAVSNLLDVNIGLVFTRFNENGSVDTTYNSGQPGKYISNDLADWNGYERIFSDHRSIVHGKDGYIYHVGRVGFHKPFGISHREYYEIRDEIMVEKFDQNGNRVLSFGTNGQSSIIDFLSNKGRTQDCGYHLDALDAAADSSGNIYIIGNTDDVPAGVRAKCNFILKMDNKGELQ